MGGNWDATSWICSKQHVATLCCSHLSFSPSILLKYMWCNHTIVLIRLQFGGIYVDPSPSDKKSRSTQIVPFACKKSLLKI